MAKAEINQFYVHYKGGIYTVLSFANHSGTVWARPRADFESNVTIPSSGRLGERVVPRFTKIPPCFRLDLHGHPEASS